MRLGPGRDISLPLNGFLFRSFQGPIFHQLMMDYPTKVQPGFSGGAVSFF